jgi:hypothetical protein
MHATQRSPCATLLHLSHSVPHRYPSRCLGQAEKCRLDVFVFQIRYQPPGSLRVRQLLRLPQQGVEYVGGQADLLCQRPLAAGVRLLAWVGVGMDDADRFRLPGTYHTPRVRYSRTVICEMRAEVKVCGLTDGPIPWPIGKRGRNQAIYCPKPRRR